MASRGVYRHGGGLSSSGACVLHSTSAAAATQDIRCKWSNMKDLSTFER